MRDIVFEKYNYSVDKGRLSFKRVTVRVLKTNGCGGRK
jgi:hypothetical protein